MQSYSNIQHDYFLIGSADSLVELTTSYNDNLRGFPTYGLHGFSGLLNFTPGSNGDKMYIFVEFSNDDIDYYPMTILSPTATLGEDELLDNPYFITGATGGTNVTKSFQLIIRDKYVRFSLKDNASGTAGQGKLIGTFSE